MAKVIESIALDSGILGLDCDVILASQAIAEGAHVVTDDVGHLGLFVSASSWRDLAVRNLDGTGKLFLETE